MARWTELGLVTALSLLSIVPRANAASLADCGNINVEANAQCKLDTGLSCKAECTPVSCSAALYASCQGTCNVVPPSCDVSCSGTCEGQCNGSASFDCSANCQGTCGGSCDSQCTTHCQNDSDQTTCMTNCNASCNATCQGECDATCNANTDVSCSGKCQASCQGSCNASARIDCQASCQADGYLRCTGGCQADCETTGGGGLFCSGQYVDVGGDLKSCVDAIEAALNIHVSGYANGSASCSGNTCQAEANAGVSCALDRLGKRKGVTGSAMILAAAGLTVGVRRRRRP